MIVLNNITVLKQGRIVFENFSFTLAAGEHWLIQGANGSGKTSLLETIAGDLPVNEGNIRYSFIDAHADWDERHRQRRQAIHYIPAHALHHLLRGYHDLFYQQRYYSLGDVSLPKVKDFFGEDLHNIQHLDIPDSFDIRNLLDLEVTRLSNGQLKKILIIKHLLKNIPKVLLLDYPFEGLDRESRAALCDLLDHLATAFKIQIVLTDHHHELPAVINRKLVLKDFSIASQEPFMRDQTIGSTGHIKNAVGATTKDNDVVVEMKALTIQYGSKKIIDNLNWKIHQGERWALTGKNGSGKTTLFSLIYADHPMAYSQQVYLFGRRRGTGESIWDIKKRINYLGPEQVHFLDAAVNGNSANEYVRATGHEDGLPEKLIAFFGAENFIHKPVRHLSSGQVQLMLLIRFFLSGKELLLLDEPFQFLDPLQKERVIEYLNGYLGKNSTLVLISHYDADIGKWTQRRMDLH